MPQNVLETVKAQAGRLRSIAILDRVTEKLRRELEREEALRAKLVNEMAGEIARGT
jgi:hypothetical protein